jgi:hypothetical protein
MTDEYKPVLLGELLTKAGLLTDEMVLESLRRSQETRLPMGKILVWSGYLNEKQLHAAVEAQSLINDKLLTLSEAIKALALVMDRRQSLDTALDELGWTPDRMFERNRLGDLMIASAMVSAEELEEALTTALSTGLPLGQVLSCCPEPLNMFVRSALHAQSMIREGKIERSQAIEALKLSKQHLVPIEQALLELGIREASILNSLEVSELLLAAGTLTPAKMMRAVEYSLCANKPISECLTDLDFVTDATIAAARHLRESVTRGELERALAVDALRRVHEDGLTLGRALAVESDRSMAGIPKVSATDLIRLASFVTREDIEKIVPDVNAQLQDAPDMLLATKAIDEDTFGTVLQCIDLIDRKSVNLQQAIVALYLCLRKNLSLPEALLTLGIRPEAL